MPTDSTIRDRVQAFADELSELLRASVLQVASAALGTEVRSGARRGRPPGPRASGKGAKRAPALLAGLVERLAAYIKTKPGQRIEEIGRALGISTRELALPAKKLLADARVKTQGQKRATRYYPGGGGRAAAAGPKPKRARKVRKGGKRSAKPGRAKKAASKTRGRKKTGRKPARKPRAAKRAPAKRAAVKRAPKSAPKARASAAPPPEKAAEASAVAE